MHLVVPSLFSRIYELLVRDVREAANIQLCLLPVGSIIIIYRAVAVTLDPMIQIHMTISSASDVFPYSMLL